MLISKRIELIIKQNGMSSSAFADRLGVQRSNISHILSGRNKPGLDLLEKIMLNFPQINAKWLLTGNGEPSNEMPIAEGSTIEQIIHFYSDGTFEIFRVKKK